MGHCRGHSANLSNDLDLDRLTQNVLRQYYVAQVRRTSTQTPPLLTAAANDSTGALAALDLLMICDGKLFQSLSVFGMKLALSVSVLAGMLI